LSRIVCCSFLLCFGFRLCGAAIGLIAALSLLRADGDSAKHQQSRNQKRQTKSKRILLHEFSSAREARSICQTEEAWAGWRQIE